MQEKLKIRYTDSFARDLDETAYCISNDLHNPDAADRFLSEVETAIEDSVCISLPSVHIQQTPISLTTGYSSAISLTFMSLLKRTAKESWK